MRYSVQTEPREIAKAETTESEARSVSVSSISEGVLVEENTE